MEKRGILQQQVFYYILAAILISLIFIFGYQQLIRLQNLNEQAKFITFKNDFQNAVDNIYYKNPGSTVTYSINSANKPLLLPKDAKQICVKKINSKTSEIYSDSKYFQELDIENLTPETNEKCFNIVNSRFSFTLENRIVNRDTIVYIG